MRNKRREALSAGRVESQASRWTSAHPSARDDDKTFAIIRHGLNTGRAALPTEYVSVVPVREDGEVYTVKSRTRSERPEAEIGSEFLTERGIDIHGIGTRKPTSYERFTAMVAAVTAPHVEWASLPKTGRLIRRHCVKG